MPVRCTARAPPMAKIDPPRRQFGLLVVLALAVLHQGAMATTKKPTMAPDFLQSGTIAARLTATNCPTPFTPHMTVVVRNLEYESANGQWMVLPGVDGSLTLDGTAGNVQDCAVGWTKRALSLGELGLFVPSADVATSEYLDLNLTWTGVLVRAC